MNEIINKLLAGYKFILEMHLRQPEFTYSACGPFTENKEKIKKFKETADSRHIPQNEIDNAFFQHDMIYGGFKGLNRRTAADKALLDKTFNIAKRLLTLLLLLVNITSGGTIRNEIISNKELAEELRKPILENLIKEKYIQLL